MTSSGHHRPHPPTAEFSCMMQSRRSAIALRHVSYEDLGLLAPVMEHNGWDVRRRDAAGGVKDSGYGREGGTEGLQCYTVVKNVSHKTTEA
jgi:hypothetical protein